MPPRIMCFRYSVATCCWLRVCLRVTVGGMFELSKHILAVVRTESV